MLEPTQNRAKLFLKLDSSFVYLEFDKMAGLIDLLNIFFHSKYKRYDAKNSDRLRIKWMLEPTQNRAK